MLLLDLTALFLICCIAEDRCFPCQLILLTFIQSMSLLSLKSELGLKTVKLLTIFISYSIIVFKIHEFEIMINNAFDMLALFILFHYIFLFDYV